MLSKFVSWSAKTIVLILVFAVTFFVSIRLIFAVVDWLNTESISSFPDDAPILVFIDKVPNIVFYSKVNELQSANTSLSYHLEGNVQQVNKYLDEQSQVYRQTGKSEIIITDWFNSINVDHEGLYKVSASSDDDRVNIVRYKIINNQLVPVSYTYYFGPGYSIIALLSALFIGFISVFLFRKHYLNKRKVLH